MLVSSGGVRNSRFGCVFFLGDRIPFICGKMGLRVGRVERSNSAAFFW